MNSQGIHAFLEKERETLKNEFVLKKTNLTRRKNRPYALKAL